MNHIQAYTKVMFLDRKADFFINYISERFPIKLQILIESNEKDFAYNKAKIIEIILSIMELTFDDINLNSSWIMLWGEIHKFVWNIQYNNRNDLILISNLIKSISTTK